MRTVRAAKVVLAVAVATVHRLIVASVAALIVVGRIGVIIGVHLNDVNVIVGIAEGCVVRKP